MKIRKILSLGIATLVLLTQSISLAQMLQFYPAPAFTDTMSHKHEPSIKFVATKSIFTGNPDGTFRPDYQINRAELAKVVARATFNGSFERFRRKCFTDVNYSAWYTPYVCFMKDQGMISGYSDGTYRPSQAVNNVEALKIVMEAYKIPKTVSGSGMPWFFPYVEDASKANLIPLDLRSVNKTMTRGQVADLIARTITYKDGSQPSFLGPIASVRHSYGALMQGRDMYQVARLLKRGVKPSQVCRVGNAVYGHGSTFKNNVGQECYCNVGDVLFCGVSGLAGPANMAPSAVSISSYNVIDTGYNSNKVRVYFSSASDADGFVSKYLAKVGSGSYQSIMNNRRYFEFSASDSFRGNFYIYAVDNKGLKGKVNSRFIDVPSKKGYNTPANLDLTFTYRSTASNYYTADLRFNDLPNVRRVRVYLNGSRVATLSSSARTYYLSNLDYNRNNKVKVESELYDGSYVFDTVNIYRSGSVADLSPNISLSYASEYSNNYRAILRWSDSSRYTYRVYDVNSGITLQSGSSPQTLSLDYGRRYNLEVQVYENGRRVGVSSNRVNVYKTVSNRNITLNRTQQTVNANTVEYRFNWTDLGSGYTYDLIDTRNNNFKHYNSGAGSTVYVHLQKNRTYGLKVRAYYNGSFAVESSVMTFTTPSSVLLRDQNVRGFHVSFNDVNPWDSAGVLTWNSVLGAANYRVTVNGSTNTVTTNRFNLPALYTNKSITIQVYNSAGGLIGSGTYSFVPRYRFSDFAPATVSFLNRTNKVNSFSVVTDITEGSFVGRSGQDLSYKIFVNGVDKDGLHPDKGRVVDNLSYNVVNTICVRSYPYGNLNHRYLNQRCSTIQPALGPVI